MYSYFADEQVVHPYGGLASMNQDAIFSPVKRQGNELQQQHIPRSNDTGHLIIIDNYGGGFPAGLEHTSNAAGRLIMKRSRTYSYEAPQGLLSQILGLLSRASSDDPQNVFSPLRVVHGRPSFLTCTFGKEL